MQRAVQRIPRSFHRDKKIQRGSFRQIGDLRGRKRTSTLPLTEFLYQSSSQSQSTHSWMMNFSAATTAAGSLFLMWQLSPALCETSTETIPQASNDDDEDDPYENLPEEDEETDCSMCNTFRKGPCRPQWRKLERCFKDHENEENGALKCMKYFKPHQQCLMEYTNLYQLISLEMKQELVRDAELSVSDKERRKWDPPVDWSVWKQFASEQGLSFKETIQRVDESQSNDRPVLLPLWKRLPSNKEPVLLTIPAPLPRIEEETGMILKIAYAVDQDGFVLGLTYNTQYGELAGKAAAKASGKQQDESKRVSTSDQSTSEGDGLESESFDFEFFVLPGETKTVRICGLYAENPVTASPDKNILDALLFKSGKHVLQMIVAKRKS